ncbi:zinc-dependent metalloprotease [Streptomyces microflavus]|uniref:zinc-dependent metalloprotease n=1 Tax=Streptomyces microflavus TaxID=1919 RepID=UPI0036774908
MTDVKVLDETGKHGYLQERVESILDEVVPVVREATRLELPALVVFRIVAPETWQTDSEADLTGFVSRFRARRPRWHAPAIGLVERVSLGRFHKVAPLLGGVLVMGATTAGPAEQSQTMLVPAALAHSGVFSSSHYLTQLVIHELVHHAQNLATLHREVWAAEKPSALLRAGSIKFVEEGHAYWADQEVTRRLFGKPKDIHTAPASIQSGIYQDALKNKIIARMRRGPDIYTEGRKIVTTAIEAVGPSLFNSVWTDLSLLPTKNELKHPAQWAERLAAGTSSTDQGAAA